ncbi:MAG: hypothetical protein AAF529_02895 [Pseudomonadota bacterium]
MQNLPLVFAAMVLCANLHAAEYRHPAGVGFTYPNDWTLQELESALLLQPPGVKPTPSGLPERFIWVGAEAMDTQNTPTQAEVAVYFDGLIRSVYSTAQRTGGETGQSLLYQVDEQRQVHIKFHFQNGLGLFMAHSYLTAQTEADSVFESAFASYGATLATDTTLLGTWYRSESAMSSIDYNYNSGGSSYVSSSQQISYTFSADQRFVWRGSSHISGNSASDSGSLGISSSADNEPDAGTYSANNGQLTLAWDEGDAVTCEYKVFPDSEGLPALKMTCGDAKPKFYKRIN